MSAPAAACGQQVPATQIPKAKSVLFLFNARMDSACLHRTSRRLVDCGRRRELQRCHARGGQQRGSALFLGFALVAALLEDLLTRPELVQLLQGF